MITKFRIGLAAAALISLVAATSCAGEQSAGKSGTVTLNVGAIPVIDVTPLYVGMQQGFFAEEQLKINPVSGTGFQASLAGVLNGDLELGFAATMPVASANAEGAPIKFVSQATVFPASLPKEEWGIITAADSAVTSLTQLRGKKVAVNALNSIQEVGVRAAVKQAGGDPNTITFVELPSSDMASALKQGRVAAAAMADPFQSQAVEQGMRILGDYTLPYPDRSPLSGWFASKQYIAENPEVMERFTRAMRKSVNYTETHPQAAVKAAQQFTKLSGESLRNALEVSEYVGDIKMKTMRELVAFLRGVGFLKSDLTAKDLVWTPQL